MIYTYVSDKWVIGDFFIRIKQIFTWGRTACMHWKGWPILAKLIHIKQCWEKNSVKFSYYSDRENSIGRYLYRIGEALKKLKETRQKSQRMRHQEIMIVVGQGHGLRGRRTWLVYSFAVLPCTCTSYSKFLALGFLICTCIRKSSTAYFSNSERWWRDRPSIRIQKPKKSLPVHQNNQSKGCWRYKEKPLEI